MRRSLALLAAVLVLAGCVSVEQMVKDASTSKRSWCVYFAGGMGVGEVRASGSGVEADDNGTASSNCDNKAGSVNMNNNGPGGGNQLFQNGTVVTPGGDVILRPPPRVYQQVAPEYKEITPAPAQPAKKGLQ